MPNEAAASLVVSLTEDDMAELIGITGTEKNAAGEPGVLAMIGCGMKLLNPRLGVIEESIEDVVLSLRKCVAYPMNRQTAYPHGDLAIAEAHLNIERVALGESLVENLPIHHGDRGVAAHHGDSSRLGEIKDILPVLSGFP